MSSLSLSDSSFLASEWIGSRKKFIDTPEHIQRVFQSLLAIPTVVKSVILPDERASVVALILKELPLTTPTNLLPDPASYFRKESAGHWAGGLSFLKNLPVPPSELVAELLKLAGQAWIDGYQLVVYSHTDNHHPFPLWLIQYWAVIHDFQPAYYEWTKANTYLTRQQRKLSENI